MLLSRAEMSYDFRGARFDPGADRGLVAWGLNQLLHLRTAGSRRDRWVLLAPDVWSARAAARQDRRRLAQTAWLLEALRRLDVEASPAHPAVRLLASGLQADTWPAYVAHELATVEGMILKCLLALEETLPGPALRPILRRLVAEVSEEVAFGEQATLAAVAGRPGLRRRLLGKSLALVWAVQALSEHRSVRHPGHAALRHLPGFLRALSHAAALRLMRLGLLDRGLDELRRRERALRIAEAWVHGGLARLGRLPGRRRPGDAVENEAWLQDPVVRRALFKVIDGRNDEAA